MQQRGGMIKCLFELEPPGWAGKLAPHKKCRHLFLTLFSEDFKCFALCTHKLLKMSNFARKRLQMKLGGLLSLSLSQWKRKNPPRFSFEFAFVMNMLGTHKPQQQAALKRKCQIAEILIRFRLNHAAKRESEIPLRTLLRISTFENPLQTLLKIESAKT